MRQISILSFTAKGAALNRDLVMFCRERYPESEVQGYTFERYPFPGLTTFGELGRLMESLFRQSRLLLFLGSAGIAVRAVAPFLEGKEKDPAVLAADELGRHVISLLSGHLGGANEFCIQIAAYLQAEPIVTTATDLTGTFAVDLFALQNGLTVTEPGSIKEISGRLLDGRQVGFFSELPVASELPEGLVRLENDEEVRRSGLEAGICLSCGAARRPFPVTCRLLPKDLAVGVGCRSGKTKTELEEFLHRTFREAGLEEKRIFGFYSIDHKRGEQGLWELARQCGVPFRTYSARELEAVPGSFRTSAFVERTVGVGNVCERSAVLGSGGGELVLSRQAADGITLAAACRKQEYRF